jgi:hypothetical protein
MLLRITKIANQNAEVSDENFAPIQDELRQELNEF